MFAPVCYKVRSTKETLTGFCHGTPRKNSKNKMCALTFISFLHTAIEAVVNMFPQVYHCKHVYETIL